MHEIDSMMRSLYDRIASRTSFTSSEKAELQGLYAALKSRLRREVDKKSNKYKREKLSKWELKYLIKASHRSLLELRAATNTNPDKWQLQEAIWGFSDLLQDLQADPGGLPQDD